MPSTYLDEILMIAFIPYIIYKRLVNKKILIAIACFISWSTLGLLVNFNLNFYSLYIIVDTLKPIILLLCFMSIDINECRFKKILDCYCVVNVPSAIVGIINGYRYNYLGLDLIINSGSLKYIDGVLVERAGGLIFTSGVFTDVCAILFICILFVYEWNKKKVLLLGLFLIALLFGRGRFPLLLTILGICLYLWMKLNYKYRKVLLISIVAFIGFSLFLIVPYVMNEYAIDIENQVRFVPYYLIGSIPVQVMLFGLGIGNIGNENSYLYNSSLYFEYGVTHYAGWDWESQLGKLLVQTGITGAILWFYPFLHGLKKALKSRSKHRNVCVFLICYYLINLVMNKSYEVQILVLVCTAISHVCRMEE